MSQSVLVNRVSLLWPDEETRKKSKKIISLSDDSCTDIGLDKLIDEFGVTGAYRAFIKSVFTNMCEDTNVINYRLDIIDDIINNPEIELCLTNIFSIACEVERISVPESADSPYVQKLVKSFRETDLYGNCLCRCKASILKVSKKLKAQGLCKLRDIVMYLSEKFEYDDNICVAEQEDEFIKPASITLGINLDTNLRPMEAAILSVNNYKYTKAPFLNRLIDGSNDFHTNYNFHPNGESGIKNTIIKGLEEASESVVRIDSSALQLSLISDLDRMMKNTINALRTIIHRYINTYSQFFVDLKYELLFFLGAVRIIKKINCIGMKMVRPKAYPKDMKVCNIKKLYNINLAFRSEQSKPITIVQNDIAFSENSNIFILTGPNSGGKTTYINALSLIQVLFQAGMYIPAQEASLSPVDNIYTHFSSEEKKDTDYGRLGEEAHRLDYIFKHATNYSFIVLNESLASTSPSECLIMSKDIVYGLKLLNVRAIFATHLHELASTIDEINTTCEGKGAVCSLVAGAERKHSLTNADCFQRTYKVIKAPPEGLSYAKDIAESFGISYAQIKKTLHQRLMI
ncbi:MutS-related protein [Clostridium oryzae]|uniref:Endonuclease MutS2 n=1 Tax=Clostridium oryzae TaxID=1450648 RepID=A0A1V4ISH8_9CLOT|nr:hypothetical protein [Clostridium oryzae]OPJ62876.1 endonuclease MutS2 [Clostridium oryzae]